MGSTINGAMLRRRVDLWLPPDASHGLLHWRSDNAANRIRTARHPGPIIKALHALDAIFHAVCEEGVPQAIINIYSKVISSIVISPIGPLNRQSPEIQKKVGHALAVMPNPTLLFQHAAVHLTHIERVDLTLIMDNIRAIDPDSYLLELGQRKLDRMV